MARSGSTLQLYKSVVAFVVRFGRDIVATHVHPAIALVMPFLRSTLVLANTVLRKILANIQKSPVDIFAMLVCKQGLNTLAAVELSDLATTEPPSTPMQGGRFAYNIMFVSLRTLLEPVGIEQVACRGCAVVVGTEMISTSQALVFLELGTKVRDVTCFSAGFLKVLDTTAAEPENKRDLLLNALPRLCCASGQTPVKLDVFLSSKAVLDMEVEG